MKKIFAVALVAAVAWAVQSSVASAHPDFKKEVTTQFGLKTVSCNTCHAKEEEVPKDQLEAYKANKKGFRNAFGQEFDKLMKEKGFSAKIKAAKVAENKPAEDAAKKEALDAFKEALKKVVDVKAPSGKTYGEELKAGTLEGVKK
jgi:hypothetical protein